MWDFLGWLWEPNIGDPERGGVVNDVQTQHPLNKFCMPIRNSRRFAVLSHALMIIAISPGCRTSPEANEAKYLKRGEALVAKKDYPRALLEFRNAASAMPKDAEPYYRMGLVYIEIRDLNSA